MKTFNSTMFVSAACLVSLAGLAHGQVTVVSASGLARATAGDGSGNNQQTSTSIAGFNLSATKNFSNGGHVDSHTQWGPSGDGWLMSGSFSAHSFAQSQFEAGFSETAVLVNFDALEDYDVEYGAGYSLNSPGGSITIDVRNRITNAYQFGGNSPNLVHLAAGQYKLTVDTDLPYGDLSGGYNIQFRPGNDRCTFARLITNGTQTGSTAYATADGTPSCGNNTSAKSVWFKYVSPRAGALKITTCGSAFDTILSVYQTNSCPSGVGSEVACDDDADAGTACFGTLQSAVTINAVANATYYIRVSGYNGAAGNFVLNVGPVNDHCDEALDITPGAYAFDNTLADTDGPVLNTCSAGGVDTQVNGDLWYEFTPAQSGTIDVDTCGSSFDTKLAVYQNPPCGPRSVFLACSDDSCSLQSKIENLSVIAGVKYSIRVGGYLNNRGTGVLNLSFAAPCPADFNGDGFVDFFDFDDFVSCFEGAGCPAGKTADFNADGFVDFFDFDDFVLAFSNGC
jgi:hypothetical protein